MDVLYGGNEHRTGRRQSARLPDKIVGMNPTLLQACWAAAKSANLRRILRACQHLAYAGTGLQRVEWPAIIA
jgi:hypothetical protein